jgi:hypothetical protein
MRLLKYGVNLSVPTTNDAYYLQLKGMPLENSLWSSLQLASSAARSFCGTGVRHSQVTDAVKARAQIWLVQ